MFWKQSATFVHSLCFNSSGTVKAMRFYSYNWAFTKLNAYVTYSSQIHIKAQSKLYPNHLYQNRYVNINKGVCSWTLSYTSYTNYEALSNDEVYTLYFVHFFTYLQGLLWTKPSQKSSDRSEWNSFLCSFEHNILFDIKRVSKKIFPPVIAEAILL